MVVSKKDLDEAVDEITKRFTDILNEKITAVAQEIAAVVLRVGTLEGIVEENQQKIINQNDEIRDLKKANADLHLRIDDLSEKLENVGSGASNIVPANVINKVQEIEERLEDRTNRQLRQTLIIRGLKEIPNETWDDTKELVAKAISKNLDVSKTEASDMLNRVHRGRPNPRNNNQPRPIYMALHNWSDCEYIVDEFRSLNIKKMSSIRAEFMYGPLTTLRRNAALLKRKTLKEEGSIISGYIQFPAKLFVKRRGAHKDDAYEFFEDYSKLKVELKPRNSNVSVNSVSDPTY